MLTHAIGPAGAWVTQAALFAGMHLRPLGGFISTFVFGLMAGLWRWRRRTLLPVILAHFAINGLLNAARWPDWLDITRVEISHDYDTDLIDLSKADPYDPKDDAYYDYERAQKSFEPISDELDVTIKLDPAQWTVEQRDAINQWIDANAQALEHLAKGTSRPYYCLHDKIGNGHWPTGSNAGAVRGLAFALNVRIKLHASEGREENMVLDVATLYRFGTHFGGKKVLVDQLVGAAIRGIALGTTRKVLAHHSLSIYTLESLHERFQTFRDGGDLLVEFGPERLFCLDAIQRIFTDDGGTPSKWGQGEEGGDQVFWPVQDPRR